MNGGANGVFGTPVGGLHLGRPQEGEHGSELAVEMGGEALGGRQGGRRVEESPEAREQAAEGGETEPRDGWGGDPRAAPAALRGRLLNPAPYW